MATSSSDRAPPSAVPEPSLPTGRITGTITLRGKPEVMRVPPKRRVAEGCGPADRPYNAVITHDGAVRDVLVRLAGEVPFPRSTVVPVERRIVLDRVSCVYEPRIQGVMVTPDGPGRTLLEIRNSDNVLHQLHAYLNRETLWAPATPRGAPPVVKEMGGPGVYTFTCDVHPWMRAFIVASPHPYFDVTGDTGQYTLSKIPPGSHEVEAWHSQYGWKKHPPITVTADVTTQVDLTYSTTDPIPDENRGETLQ